jgi:hypothetical protein
MRTRVKMSGLIVHTTPDGKSRTSNENRCQMGIKKLQRLVDEGYELTGVRKKDGKFRLFGTIECKFEIPLEILIKAGFK